jgi:hypothetical protein
MKKSLPYFVGLCLIALGVLVYSCSKRFEEPSKLDMLNGTTTVPDYLLKAAEEWHSQETKTEGDITVLSNAKKTYVLPPDWRGAKMMQGSGSVKIIVPGPDAGNSTDFGRDLVRKFVFTEDNGKITDGKIIEIYSSKEAIGKDSSSLTENYLKGKMEGFTGSVISYDVNYKRQKSQVYINGVVDNNKKAEVTSMKVSTYNEKFADKAKKTLGTNALAVPITSLSYDCYYLVETWWHYNGYSWENWGSYIIDYYCYENGNNEAGGGGGGSGTGCNSVGKDGKRVNCNVPGDGTPIFGLNNSNAIVANTNFHSLLNYIRSTGNVVWQPYNTVLTVNGVNYNGQMTLITDPAGKTIVGYFAPSSNSSQFPLGYNYAIGNGNDPAPNPNPDYSYLFGSTAPGLESGSVSYTPIGGGGGGGSSVPVNITNNCQNICLYNMVENARAKDIQFEVGQSMNSIFTGNTHFNLKFKDGPLAQNLDGVTDVLSASGTYNYQRNGYYPLTGMDLEITLNSTVLPGSSKEYVAVTILHEALHAYFRTQHIAFSHWVMYNQYIPWFTQALLAMYPNLDPFDAKALALGGLTQGTGFMSTLDQINLSSYIDKNNKYRTGQLGTPCP